MLLLLLLKRQAGGLRHQLRGEDRSLLERATARQVPGPADHGSAGVLLGTQGACGVFLGREAVGRAGSFACCELLPEGGLCQNHIGRILLWGFCLRVNRKEGGRKERRE